MQSENKALTNENKSRSVLIDVLKGIGIILVVLGHLDTGGQLSRQIIFSFHMPLFFFLSGVVTKTKVADTKSYILKILKSTYLPYAVFVIFDVFLKYFLHHIHDILKLLKITLSCLCGVGFYCVNSPIWFLFSIFICKIVFCLIGKIKPLLIASFVASGAFVFAYCIFDWSKLAEMPIFWTVPGWFFFVLGYYLKNYILNFEEYSKKLGAILGFVFSLILYCLLIKHSSYVSMKSLEIDNPYLYFINALLGIYIITFAFNYIMKLKPIASVLCYYGKNSIYVLVYHYFFTRIIFPYIYKKLEISDYLYSLISQMVLLVITMLILIPLIFISNNYFYFIFGKKKVRKEKKENNNG